MYKSEVFGKLLRLVAEETEVSEESILGTEKDMETTDARYVLVVLLAEAGLYPTQTAILLNRTPREYTICLAGISHPQWSESIWNE